MTSAPKVLLILGLASLTGNSSCTTAPKETAKGKAVKIITSPFAETCVQLGKFKYDGTPFIHDKELLIMMKELAAGLKGNAVKLDVFKPGVTGVSNAKGRGTAYNCKKGALEKYLAAHPEQIPGDKSDKEKWHPAELPEEDE